MTKLEAFIRSFPWVRNESTPFANMRKSIPDCRVALVSTGGLYVQGDEPFSIITRDDVDETYRKIPKEVLLSQLCVAHEHFNKSYCEKDLNVIFPLERIKALVNEGLIGDVADTNYSISGYIPSPSKLFSTGQEIAQSMLDQGVDAALMVPV